VELDGSVTNLIRGMRSGDAEAARRIWDRYSPCLAALAEERLPIWMRAVVDGDDVANDALCSVVIGLREGCFPDLQDRDDLWALLACITLRKAINEKHKAARQKRRPTQGVERIEVRPNLATREQPPDLAFKAAEQFERLIDRLHAKDELLELIALWKFEGYTSAEIAKRLGCSSRRVARKLDLIRMIWNTEGVV
jgi:DNA-directed RNA polymerase specialized sigma24 family protein